MRIVVAAVAMVACWGLIGAAQEKKGDAKKGNEPYQDAQGEFSIQFPANAKVTTTNQDTRDGTTMQAVVAEWGPGKTCVVIYLDVPDAGKRPKVFFEAAEKAAKGKGDTVDGAKEFIGPNETPGYEFTAVGKDGRKLQTRMLVYKSRVYTIVFGTNDKNFPTDEAKKVLDSFAFTTK